ncbi:MAG: SDR family oxidoreductase [Desulfobacterales bacterium]|nr:SDR family oxidoreductase [Desulfobacterales bacterium]
MPRSVLITGASSGIGAALAHELAARGHDLALCARRLDRLEALRTAVHQHHPKVTVEIRALDVTRDEQVASVLADSAAALGGLDTVVVNAGIGLGEKIGHGQFDKCRRTVETNLLGAMATTDAAVEHFLARGHGHIVGISSIMAFRGLARNAAYSASKAGLANYLQALRPYLRRKGIDVTIFYPGFIDTPLNDMLPHRPFLISSEKGARLMADRMERRVKAAMIPSWPWALVKWVLRVLPDRVMAKA